MENNFTESDATPAPTRLTLLERDIAKMEFYKTYDLMTGVRIAATLGSFFSIMVLLVVYKSKCKSRSLSEENLEAAVAAAVAEEAALETEPCFVKGLRMCGGRRSLGNVSAPVVYMRCSASPRYSARVSLPTPYLYPTPLLPTFKQDCNEEVLLGKILGGGQDWLDVCSRRDSRRLSSLTNSSFYLERRGSVMEDIPFHLPPSFLHRDHLIEEPSQYFNSINIKVTNPTPEISPCVSKDSVYDTSLQKEKLCIPKVAPLASVGSIGLPSTEQDNHSIGSDSVFLDEELVDTEDEVEGFSTDSDNADFSNPDHPARSDRVLHRRYSSPSPLKKLDNHSSLKKPTDNCSTSIISLEDRIGTEVRLNTSLSDSGTLGRQADRKPKLSSAMNMSASCGQLVKALQDFNTRSCSSKSVCQQDFWSRETLF